LIEARCEQLGIQRILLCSHAATIIAIGRTLLHDDHNAQRSPRIGAGTASLSKYLRQPNAPWLQQLNGDASFLPSGVEREWQFDMVPDNATEPGMGPDWSDPEHPTKAKHSHFSFHPQKLFNKL
jgi:transcription factor C subunit 7